MRRWAQGLAAAQLGYSGQEGVFGRAELGWHPTQDLSLFSYGEASTRLGVNAGLGARFTATRMAGTGRSKAGLRGGSDGPEPIPGNELVTAKALRPSGGWLRSDTTFSCFWCNHCFLRRGIDASSACPPTRATTYSTAPGRAHFDHDRQMDSDGDHK